ncbi:MAG: ABC transporter ATP-binding protein [Elusimicrobiota bacterium]|jgi:NitT/TauT family transport system ATP-binding protein
MSPAPPKIEFDAVEHRYARGLLAVEDIRFSVGKGEFLCVLGPSGCGKSTLLHLAAGLFPPSKGSVRVDGRPVLGPGPDRCMVFQQHGLFPWLSAGENVAFGPRMRGLRSDEQRRIARRCLEEVGLEGRENAYPRELSVGMRQRVGLARAFANEPAVLLMDEPFASLDALTRRQMQGLLKSVWKRHGSTVIFVTHDVSESLLLADRILVLSPSPGRISKEFLPDPRAAGRLEAEILSQLSFAG